MERDERNLVDGIDRYWDAVATGSPTASLSGGVPDLANLIDRLHVEHGVLPHLVRDPHQAWRDLGLQLMELTPDPPHCSDTSSVSPLPSRLNGRLSELGSPPRTPARRVSAGWIVAQLATVGLVLLSLLGYVLLHQHYPEPNDEEAWIPPLVRALEAVPGEVVDQVFVDAKFSIEELPAGDAEALYYRLTLQPGAHFSDLATPTWCGCLVDLVSKGVGVEVVQSGAYSLRLDTLLRVQRNGARETTTVPAQTEVTLGPGDAVIIPDYTAAGDIRNVGNDPVVLTGLAIFSTEDSGRQAPELPEGVRAEVLTYAVPSDWKRLPAGPVRVSVRKLTLSAGANVGPYEPVGLEAMWIEQGATHRSLYGRGATAPSGPRLFRGKGQALPFFGATSGVRHEIDVGDEPAELLVVLIEPAGITLQTLAS